MRFIPVLLLIVFMPLIASGAEVARIVDGDTIILNDSSRVRLYGIDCPERGQPGEAEATGATTQFVLGKTVTLEALYLDRYGRTVAIVTLENGGTLQEALLQKGVAWVAPRYCKRPECVYWKDLEQAARLSEIGIWQDGHAIPPWEWRGRNQDSRESK